MLLVVLILAFYLYTPQFLAPSNILILLAQSSILLLVSTAVTFPILMASIDLSVAANATLTGIVAALFIPKLGVYAVIPAILMGTAFGAINGLVYVYFKLPSFLVTLGTMSIMDGTGLLLSGGTPIWFQNDAFTWIAKGSLFINLQNIVIWAVLVYIIFSFIGNNTKFGRYTYAIGGNEEAARFSGINIKNMKVLIYSLCGLCAAVSGVILASRLFSGDPKAGMLYELDAIAAAVVGGTSLAGGKGTMIGTFLGALIIGVITNGLNLLGVESYTQNIIKGAVILIAVLLDQLRKKQ